MIAQANDDRVLINLHAFVARNSIVSSRVIKVPVGVELGAFVGQSADDAFPCSNLGYGADTAHGAAAFAVLDQGLISAVCHANTREPASLGPLTADGNVPPDLLRDLVSTAALRMHHLGYRYVVSTEDICRHLNVKGVSIEKYADARLPDRDTGDPWGDIYMPLTHAADVADLEVVVDAEKYVVRRPKPSEGLTLVRFVEAIWGLGWASEVSTALSARPVSCVVAVRPGIRGDAREWLAGFMTYNVTAPGFTSSTGIVPAIRGRGVGLARALYKRTLAELSIEGFTFAVHGGVSKRLGLLRESQHAFTIPGSYPGVFAHGEEKL